MWNAVERREGTNINISDARDPFEIDYARIIHSASFRRMQGKTQIFSIGDSDFYRTRLTHSLEVSQIANGIVQHLRKISEFTKDTELATLLPDAPLIQTIGMVHDLGHPPFGHSGEVALNYCMRDVGGFEGNGQTLRILSRLEQFSDAAGANLTKRSLLGILKYPAPYSKAKNKHLVAQLKKYESGKSFLDVRNSKPPKCYLDTEKEIIDWLLEGVSDQEKSSFQEVKFSGNSAHGQTCHKSFDCSIMDVADEISYGVHDLEDAISMNLLRQRDFIENITIEKCNSFLKFLMETYSDEFSGDKNQCYQTFTAKLFDTRSHVRKKQIGRLVHFFITHVIIEDHAQIFKEPVLRYAVHLAPEEDDLCRSLAKFIKDRVILNPKVQHLEFKGQQMVIEMFDAFMHSPKTLLPPKHYSKFLESEEVLAGQGARIVCDYIAGMTDGYFSRIYQRLFTPGSGSVFDHL